MSKGLVWLVMSLASISSFVEVSALAGDKIKVGIYAGDRRTCANKELAETLESSGEFETGTYTNPDVLNGKIYQYDVLILTGGFNSGHKWASLPYRLIYTEYVQRGFGMMANGFRTGWVRTTAQHFFPEVGGAINKVNARALIVTDKTHPVTQGLPERFEHDYWDHCVMQVGPKGKTLMVDNDDWPVAVAGEIGTGRFLLYGGNFAISHEGKPCVAEGVERKLILNCVKWLASGTGKDRANPSQVRDSIKLRLTRQERIWESTHEQRGFYYNCGLLPSIRCELQEQIDRLKYAVRDMRPYLKPEEARSLAKSVGLVETQLESKYQRLTKERVAQIGKMTLDELSEKEDKEKLTADWRAAMSAIDGFSRLQEQFEAHKAAVHPKLRAKRQAAERKQRERDREAVLSLIRTASGPDARAAAQATLELGRIGDARATPALISLIKHSSYPVRRNAILALGWMQSEAAVPALLEAAQSEDRWTRRRATTALGVIGSRGASDRLLALLKDSDHYVRENAILSLGWLREPKAVPELLPIVKDADTHRATDVLCAIRALGHIGNPAAVPVLKPLADVKGRRPPFRVVFAREGIAEIESAPKEPTAIGIRQPEFLSLPEHFYWLTRQYNCGLGRYFGYFGNRPKDPYAFVDYARAIGATCEIDGGRNSVLGKLGEEKFHDLLGYFDFKGLKWLTTWRRAAGNYVDKAFLERETLTWMEFPAFGGLWGEESLGASAGATPATLAAHLSRKYSAEKLAELGVPDLAKLVLPTFETRKASMFLWAEYLEHLGDLITEDWQEAQEWLHALRKNTGLTWSQTTGCFPHNKSNYLSAYPRLSQSIDVSGPEDYAAHAYECSFNADLARDGEVRPVMVEYYAHYSLNVPCVERGFAASLFHGEWFFVWFLGQVFKHTPVHYPLWAWEAGRWAALERVVTKARKIEEYLVGTRAETPVALLYPGRTGDLLYGTGHPDTARGGRHTRFYQNQEALWEALTKSQVQADTIWLETTDREKLGRYRIALLSDGRCLTEAEIAMVREWVREGGALVATGATSLRDQWGRPRKDYALADVFGAKWVRRQGGPPDDDLWQYVERDLKPGSGITKLKPIAPDPSLGSLSPQQAIEYDVSCGYDVVKPTSGRVLAKWESGEPAIVTNRFGKGTCTLITALYPGLSHTTKGWAVHALYKEFWPGARELIAESVRGAAAGARFTLPFTVKDCPEYVEIAIRSQPDKNRWMLHLLNYDPRLTNVSGIELSVRPPSLGNLKMFYPSDGEAAEHQVEDDRVVVRPRSFDIHEVLVIEW